MSKASRSIVLALLLLNAQAVYYIMPDQYMSIMTCNPPNSLWSTKLGITLDLASYSASLGKDYLKWFTNFKASFGAGGFIFKETKYSFESTLQFFGDFYPAGGPTKAMQDSPYDNRVLSFGIVNPNLSIIRKADSFYTVMVLFTLTNGDQILAKKVRNCTDFIVAPANVVSTKPNFLDSGNCINFSVGNKYESLNIGSYYSLVFNPAPYNPKGLPGSAIGAMSTNNATLYRDGQKLNIVPTASGGSWAFIGAINLTTQAFLKTHNWALCDTYAPPNYTNYIKFAFVDEKNATISIGNIIAKSANAMSVTSTPLVQSSTAAQTADVISVQINSLQPFNFADTWVLRVTLPPAYLAGFPVTVSCLSLLDNSVKSVSMTLPSAVFDAAMPSQVIDLKKGIKITITGLYNPLPGSYPVSFQILNSNKQTLAQLVTKTMVSV